MTNYNDGKWHGWNGGECPVHPKTLVDTRWQDESRGSLGEILAGNVMSECWTHTNSIKHCNRIIAFRVIKEHREPREWWIYPDTGVVKKTKPVCPHAIHVREVLE